MYKYNRLAYGVSSASAIFQSVMDSVLACISGVMCRIDGILTTVLSDDVHLKRLEEVVRHLHTQHEVNCEQMCFYSESVIFMGHLIDAEGIHPTNDKV